MSTKLYLNAPYPWLLGLLASYACLIVNEETINQYGNTSNSPDEVNGTEYYPRDVEKAKQMIADSGLTPEQLTFTLAYSTAFDFADIATVFQAHMAEIGVAIIPEPLETTVVANRVTVDKVVQMYLWSYKTSPYNPFGHGSRDHRRWPRGFLSLCFRP